MIKSRLLTSLYFSILFTVLATGCTPKSKEQSLSSPGRPGQSQEETKQVAQKEVWTCPMHPQIRKDAPGHCPICGMTLVKVDTSEESSSGASGGVIPESHAPFSLPAERQQLIGVKTGMAEKKRLFKSIRAAGRLAFDPELYTTHNEYADALRQLERV